MGLLICRPVIKYCVTKRQKFQLFTNVRSTGKRCHFRSLERTNATCTARMKAIIASSTPKTAAYSTYSRVPNNINN